ncbi:MAG: type I restriction endonuclease subunit R [Pontiellaceae bacterium]|nr:type I restriction endonuclease subunit R [Pontiellaceae bacterium]
MSFNEDSRVKIPAILHLCRLGYTYLSKDGAVWDEATNIFPDIFRESVAGINSGKELDRADLKRLQAEVSLLLDNEDMGKAFYERLVQKSDVRLIDFENFENNVFHVLTELPCKNGDEEFRPDITLLINGMPLVFIEVKKPNNKDGVLAERKRIDDRFRNPKFRRFMNITQVMVFSNNMEYDSESLQPIEGAFYATPSLNGVKFNYFREELDLDLDRLLAPEDDALEDLVLEDNNLEVIKYNPEFLTNKNPDSPTNRLSTSLFSWERLAFFLKYSIAFVREETGVQKHIMRYPQFFATKAIEHKLDAGERKGIIWHTQGSGKTALAFYNVKFLTEYYSRKGIIPKFYFIVDRIDLLIQAKREFASRGLVVHEISSKEAFAEEIRETRAVHNASGRPEITVVNIHRFADDPDVVSAMDYNINVQRIYFLDEVHRSYNPTGSFLANLSESDRNAIKIGLTGTPLIGETRASKHLFGDYIHKYYYNASIADGYTLRLIREEISTSYKYILKEALDAIGLPRGAVKSREAYAKRQFVEPMLDYVIEDFKDSRIRLGDDTIGGMVICDSSPQARMLAQIFEEKYGTVQTEVLGAVAETQGEAYHTATDVPCKGLSAALILHDEGTKEERKGLIDQFKTGKIDLLFVYNMLLTGFDAPRLKKLYLNRVVKAHNLLQALTRVNRTYKNHYYGYVVDFADIETEFTKTNEDYFKELNEILGNDEEEWSKLFKSKEEILADIEAIKDVLFRFDTANAEVFSQQISQIQDRMEVLEIKKALQCARELYNIIRYSGQYDLLDEIDFRKLNQLYTEVSNHLALLNLKEDLENAADTTALLNMALEDVVFMFEKIGEEELKLADELKGMLRKTREAMARNIDPQDPAFISLREELERLFKKKKLNEVTQQEMVQNIGTLRKIYEKVKKLNRLNDELKAKYHHDAKYVRIHKRLMESGALSAKERQIHEALLGIKAAADGFVLKNPAVMNHDDYFYGEMIRLVIDQFKNKRGFPLNAETSKFINQLVVNEYRREYQGMAA